MRTICLILSLFLTVSLSAQKYGFMSSSDIIQQMPDVKAADAQLIEFQKSLEAEGKKKMDKFQTSYQAYLNEVDEGLLSQLQIQEREELLAKSRQDIGKFEQEAQMKIAQKREELLGPILEKVDKAIQEVGKENNFTFIFDTSASGTLLYAPEGDDISSLVKAKLGID